MKSAHEGNFFLYLIHVFRLGIWQNSHIRANTEGFGLSCCWLEPEAISVSYCPELFGSVISLWCWQRDLFSPVVVPGMFLLDHVLLCWIPNQPQKLIGAQLFQSFMCSIQTNTLKYWYCRAAQILRTAIPSATCHTTQLEDQSRLENRLLKTPICNKETKLRKGKATDSFIKILCHRKDFSQHSEQVQEHG